MLEEGQEPWNTMHTNSNRFVGVAIKTTGPDPRLHELVQICVFPLNSRCELSKDIIPFNFDMRPLKNQKIININKGNLNREKYEQILTCTYTPQDAAMIFDKWVEDKIRLAYRKKLLPIAHNWAWQRPFIKNWLGKLNFEEYFSHEYRDLMSVALFANDYADIHSHQYPYPRVDLGYLAKTLHIEYKRLDETILIVKAITEVYRKMLQKILPTL